MKFTGNKLRLIKKKFFFPQTEDAERRTYLAQKFGAEVPSVRKDYSILSYTTQVGYKSVRRIGENKLENEKN